MNTGSTTDPQAASPAATPKQAPSAIGLSLLAALALQPPSEFIDHMQALALRTGARISISPNPLSSVKGAPQDVWGQRLDQLFPYPVNTFVKATGHRAVIGSLDQIEAMLRGEAGTQVRADGAATL